MTPHELQDLRARCISEENDEIAFVERVMSATPDEHGWVEVDGCMYRPDDYGFTACDVCGRDLPIIEGGAPNVCARCMDDFELSELA